MNFTAIDFETANRDRNSACSVAVVEVRAGELYDSFYTLIRPPEGTRFDPNCIMVHGIYPEDVRCQPTFEEIWPALRPRLAGKSVIAHNATFDMSVLRACLETYRIPKPQFQYFCTVQMARRVWPQMVNHKLNTLADYFHIDFQHHNAMDDARTCAYLAVLAGREMECKKLHELAYQIKWNGKAF
ncbi:MAG: 3'-5' exonuclease [Selenomonadales bacterium]|nr:3'-5' exonuclease [Selenomonadales bacterium]